MPKDSARNCPKCKADLLPIGSVFEPVIKAGIDILKAGAPLARIFLCQTCKQVVWMDKTGRKSIKPLGGSKPKGKRRKPKKGGAQGR